ncbi:triacylglycerol lipase [Phakopsora pachyrhizi]|uniref:Triacylglycerol lipase n=1 Tax=Phakopsora pachyrhizi TaxID=170000 RepID=A0AAV0BG92_PHAPC|nr:triacylglycerol lipase [Phakopsora pachyrhizi]
MRYRSFQRVLTQFKFKASWNKGLRFLKSSYYSSINKNVRDDSKDLSRLDSILRLGPVLFDPVRVPRSPIVLCHGLYGFSVRGPSSFPRFQIHYWGKLLEILRKRLGVKVIIGRVPSTGTVEQRAKSLNEMLLNETDLNVRGLSRVGEFNLLGHSMGGLDARYLISRLRPEKYRVKSLTTICTPHRSLKEPLLRSSTSKDSFRYLPNNLIKNFLLGLLDSPAYSNLSTEFLNNRFNPETPDDPRVMYFSIASKITESLSILHPLWLTSLVLDRLGAQEEGGHDGLVTVDSAKWGEFLGVVSGSDHWEIRGSSAFGTNGRIESDKLFNQQAKSTWLELNRYIGRRTSDDSNKRLSIDSLQENQKASYEQFTSPSSSSSSIYALADWISKRLPISKTTERFQSEDVSMKDRKASKSILFSNGIDNRKYNRTIDCSFPLNDLRFDKNDHLTISSKPNSNHSSRDHYHQDIDDDKIGEIGKDRFDLERLYTAICRNLYDKGL